MNRACRTSDIHACWPTRTTAALYACCIGVASPEVRQLTQIAGGNSEQKMGQDSFPGFDILMAVAARSNDVGRIPLGVSNGNNEQWENAESGAQ